MTRYTHIGHMIALVGLALSARSNPVQEYTIRDRGPQVSEIYCTDGRLKRGKGDKRRARRNGERWT